ncbi:MAG: ChaN family lipoprotein [Sedimenticola sp.]|nr:ChaN family lipoprotein [Sedimenticola sp.]MCW8920843.1 ChaN family lipoprotein [Sedimenticola sp.]MCW8976824.1 ChaN family lipoprotein [Sedimenticola sp.]
MVIARYPFFLLIILSVMMLSACGNTVVHKGAPIDHYPKTTDGIIDPVEIATVLDLRQTTNIESLIPSLRDNRVVYIGETHDNYSHHNAQFEIIAALKAQGADLAIGMEMFQRPFQKYLDDYIAGTITEAEMLRKTEWYDRWVYDYRYYRPILNFAQEYGIPVIALNTPREITSQVSKQGIESLTDQQRSQIPADIDYSDAAYSERLRAIFRQHDEKAERNFERFKQVQLLWDEGMALRAADYLKEHPGKQLVVLAGSGHLMHGSGIPNRVKRRLPVASAIVLPGGDLKVEPGIADFIIFPRKVSLPAAALMGIYMDQTAEGVRVSELAKEGAAEKSGIQRDDVIVGFDGVDVTSTADIRIGLLSKRPGDHVRVDVLRKGVLFGSKRIAMDLVLGE